MNNTQMLKGFLEGCVLSILNGSKLYSQEICAELRRKGFSDMSEGTLFPLLLRMGKEDIFVTEKVENPLGPSRKYYSLNEKGKEKLNRFLEDWKEFKIIIDNITGE